jgi:hypothetical protein
VPPWADPGGAAAAGLAEARKRLDDHLRFRLGRGTAAPALVVLFGGTGVGKSTVFNTLAGSAVTETSAKRPCTTEPLLYHHSGAKAALEDPGFLASYTKKPRAPGQPSAGSMGIELHAHDDATLASLALVDAPDFDSIEAENRRVAEDLYRVADLVIFVVNPAKYADEETWKSIRRARADGKAATFVFNRAEPDDDALADFRALVDGAPVVVVPRDPGAPAAGLVSDPASAARLRDSLASFLLGDAADRLRLAELRRSWDAFSGLLERDVLPALRAAAAAIAEGRKAAAAQAATAGSGLVEEVKLDQSHDLDRVSRLVRENLFSVVGFVSRKILGPIAALFDRLTGSLGRALSSSRPEIESALARVHDNNRQAARKHLGLAHERLGRALPPALVETRDFGAALFPGPELEKLYEQGLVEFEAWRKAEFDRLVGDIRGKKSVQLFVVQVLYVGVTVATMAHTGGAIHLLEGFLAGPIIVALDKIFVKAIDWDLVRDLEKRGRERFLALFAALATRQAERWERFFASQAAGLEGLGALEAALRDLKRDMPPLLDALEGRGA